MVPARLTLPQMSSTKLGRKPSRSPWVGGGARKCPMCSPTTPSSSSSSHPARPWCTLAGHPLPGGHRTAVPQGAGGGGTRWSPPSAHAHAGAPARRCIDRRQRAAGGSHSHASCMWFKEQVPTSLTLTVPALLRGQPDLPLICSDHRTNGLNKILPD